MQGTLKKICKPENLVVFQKPCTKNKISYWELRPKYQEFRDEISCDDIGFDVTYDIYIHNSVSCL